MSSPLKKGVIMVGFWIFAILALICGSILFGIYMVCCAEEGIKMFEDKSIYERRLENLEEQVRKLMEEN
jgi:hypothetical protein